MSAADYKKLIVSKSAETLRSADFKKQGMHFSRSVNDVVHLVSFQSSSGSTAALVKITLNLGVWLRVLAEDWQKPDILEAHWRQRIGLLMPDHNDHWWAVSSEQESNVAASEIDETVRKYVLPQLEILSTSESLKKLWLAGVSLGTTSRLATRYLERLGKERAS